MAGDPLQDVQLDAGISHPRQCRVPEPMPDQTLQAELSDQCIPPRRITQRRRRDHTAARTDHQPLIATPSSREPENGWTQGVDDRHRTATAAFGFLGDQTTTSGIDLPRDVEQPPAQVDVADSQPGDLADTQPGCRQDRCRVVVDCRDCRLALGRIA